MGVTFSLETLMQKYTDLTKDVLDQTLIYCPSSGQLTWRPRSRDWFKSNASYVRYNKLSANTPALTANNGEGYKTGTLLGARVKAHQVIWVMLHGSLPEKGKEIDHINGDRSDNRLENLRCVDKSDNSKNQKLCSRNQTGVSGVSWYKPTKKWLVRINVAKKTKCLGYFDDFKEACEVRAQAEKENNYHKNHGKR